MGDCQKKLTKLQCETLYNKLVAIAKNTKDPDEGKEDDKSEIYQNYSLKTWKGLSFYEQISDEMLLEVIRKKGEELGYSPGQKEMFWVWRSYIKQRFQKWPYALVAAGLSKSAGKGGKPLSKVRQETEEYNLLLGKLRKRAQELCRIPHPQEIPEISQQLGKYSGSWRKILHDAGVDRDFFNKNALYKISDLEEVYCKDLIFIKYLADQLHRPPFKEELPGDLRERLVNRCGSYRNVLFQIDMEPVQKKSPFSLTSTKEDGDIKKKIHNIKLEECCYQIINPDSQTLEDILALYKIWKKEGGNLERKNVDPVLRKRLQKSCGTWANAVYQIRFVKEKEKNEKKC